MWKKIKKIFKKKEKKIKPTVNKLLSLYIKYDDVIAKGVKPAVHQAVKMGYVDESKEKKLVKQIEKGMKQAADEMEKRQEKNGEVW